MLECLHIWELTGPLSTNLKRSKQNSTYVLFLVVAILLLFIAPEEEVQRRTLDLDYGVEAAKRYN